MRRAVVLLTLIGCLTTNALATDLEAERTRLEAEWQALAANAAGMTESERLARFIDLAEENMMLEYPEMATYRGVEGDHGRWSDNSRQAAEREEQAMFERYELLKSIDRDQIEVEDLLDYDLLLEQLERNIAAEEFPGEFLQISQMGGPHSQVAQMLSMMPTFRVDQYEDILSRMAGAPTLIENTIDWLREGLEKGVTPPQVTLRNVGEQFNALLVDDPMTSPVLRPFTEFPDSIPAEEQQRLTAEAKRIYVEDLMPALTELRAFLVDEYIPGARQSIAMSDLPDGEAWYALRAHQSTTTDLTPRQIHDIGKSEVARIRGEMDKIIEEVGFGGTFAEFTEFLRTDPQFYFTDPEELLATYRDIAKRADIKLVEQFGYLPRLPYGVVPIPDYMAKSATTAYYSPGSLEGGRAGKFYANTYKLETRPKWEMEALTLHEAVPGHHLQIAIGQELEDLPWFRRFGGYSAFVEGWGLYAESLGEEMGFYEDPYSKFGQLTYEMWRAIRLVVDTGMHALGWTRQEAIDYFIDNSAKTEHDIVVEVDRYIVWPGQALAYKIGELKIQELRAYAIEQLGDAFDVRTFHDQLLGNGALPLSVLEEHIHQWVEDQKDPEVATPDQRGP